MTSPAEPAGTADAAAEFAALARTAGLDVPADLLPAVLHGYRGLREQVALLRASTARARGCPAEPAS